MADTVSSVPQFDDPVGFFGPYPSLGDEDRGGQSQHKGRARSFNEHLPSFSSTLDAIPASQQFSHFDLDIALKCKDFDDKLHDQWSAGTAAFLR